MGSALSRALDCFCHVCFDCFVVPILSALRHVLCCAVSVCQRITPNKIMDMCVRARMHMSTYIDSRHVTPRQQTVDICIAFHCPTTQHVLSGYPHGCTAMALVFETRRAIMQLAGSSPPLRSTVPSLSGQSTQSRLDSHRTCTRPSHPCSTECVRTAVDSTLSSVRSPTRRR